MRIGAILDLRAIVRRTDLAVPDVDILLDSVAERLIAEAGG